MVKNINLEKGALILFIKRKNHKIIPKGDTVILCNDEIVVGTTVTDVKNEVKLYETNIDSTHEWRNKKIKDISYSENFLITLIKRKNESFVPNGNTEIKLGDTIIFYEI